MRKHISKLSLLAIVLMVANPAFAGMAPSKTAADQSLESRDADLAVVQQVVSAEGVAEALAAHGYTAEEVQTRLAALSSEDLASLAGNLEQIQAAGLTSQEWTYILIGAVVVLLIVLL